SFARPAAAAGALKKAARQGLVKEPAMRTATAFLVLLVGGCAAGPDYERPAAPAPGAFREIPAGWKEAEPRDEIARARWWELFGDAELNALAERVESGNYSVAAAAARYRSEERRVGTERRYRQTAYTYSKP